MVNARSIKCSLVVLAAVCTAGLSQAKITWKVPELDPCVSVLLMGSEAESLAAEEALYQMGIPHYTTRSVGKATKAAILLVSFGQVDEVDQAFAERLASYVTQGGVVIAQKVRDPKLADLFGFDQAVAAKNRHEIIWADLAHPIKKYVDTLEEEVLRLGSYNHEELFWTVGYLEGRATTVARFEDGTAAVTDMINGSGRAIALGGSLIDLILRSYLDKDYGVHKVGSNAFEPSTDMYLLMLKAAYQHFVPHGLVVSTITPGKRSFLILTHDIDSKTAFVNAGEFARVEKGYGAHSTIFVQTKYVTDYYDDAFLNDENLNRIRKLHDAGFEIGSHTVSRTPHFYRLPRGRRVSRPEEYRPRVLSISQTIGATVYGEAAVSKNILEERVTNRVTSFRSGHLLLNRHLVRSLEDTGYEYDSSAGVYHCACNFPFRQLLDRSFSKPSSILEIPVTISDCHWTGSLTERIPIHRQIILKNAANGAPTTLLIHPTRTRDKLEALDQLLTWLPKDIDAGTMREFARFWNGRYGLNPSVERIAGGWLYEFSPDRPTDEVAIILNSEPDSIRTEPAARRSDSTTVVLPALRPGQSIRLWIVDRPPQTSSVTIYSPANR